MPSSPMIIAGAALQGLGLGFVFFEVIAIRIQEFGEPAWLNRTRHWLAVHHLLPRRDVSVRVDAAGRLILDGWLDAEKLRPEPLADDASDAERLARLERYVTLMDEDLVRLPETIRRQVGTATARAREGDQAIEAAFEAREQRRRQALKRSLWRQGIGSAFVLSGLIVGTLGAVN